MFCLTELPVTDGVAILLPFSAVRFAAARFVTVRIALSIAAIDYVVTDIEWAYFS